MKKNLKIVIAVCVTAFCVLIVNNLLAQRADGDYVISAISLEDMSVKDTLQNVPVFEDASINCLLNSQWEFTKGDGYYKISSANSCTKGVRQIAWKFFNLKGSNYFQFVRTSAVHGVRADVHNIYICEVKTYAKDNFVLRYPILFADKPNAILITFTRQ